MPNTFLQSDSIFYARLILHDTALRTGSIKRFFPALTCLALILFSSLFSFNSSALAADLRFVVMGDNRPDFIGPPPFVYYKIISKIAALKPDCVFSTGDIIRGYTDNRTRICQMFEDFKKASKNISSFPFFVAPGDHDLGHNSKFKKDFVHRFGPTYHSFDSHNNHFVILSSEEPGETCRIVGEQFKWLKKDLEASKSADHTFIFVHRPLYPTLRHIGHSLDRYTDDRDRLADLLKRYHIDMVFCGHEHGYNFTVVDGLPQMITAGAGAPLHVNREKGGFNHFVYVTVSGNSIDYRLAIVENEIKAAEELIMSSKPKEAIVFLEKAKSCVPHHPTAYADAVVAFHLLGDSGNRKTNYEKLLSIAGLETSALLIAADSAFRMGKWNISKGYLIQVIQRDDTNFNAYRLLGHINQKERHYGKAIEHYGKALSLTDNSYLESKIKKKIVNLRLKLPQT